MGATQKLLTAIEIILSIAESLKVFDYRAMEQYQVLRHIQKQVTQGNDSFL